MVEMSEAANIMNNLTERSLVLFDELGRGTSTYDGISIAWSIVEHIHENPTAHARTLFATHYHELNEMENRFARIKNYNVSVREVDHRIVFLRKLARGGSEHSFGIHVARLAGMPSNIVRRAESILHHLEANRADDRENVGATSEVPTENTQMWQLPTPNCRFPNLTTPCSRLCAMRYSISTSTISPLWKPSTACMKSVKYSPDRPKVCSGE